jgi:hypothetical protein
VLAIDSLKTLDLPPDQKLAGQTLQHLAAHPEWIPPRSDLRVFLGEPGAPEATKTTVEPGNVFSPGMRTFGVTWWLRFPASGAFFATELAPLESLRWRYEDGYLPLLHCETQVDALAVHHRLFQDGTTAQFSEAVCGELALTNNAATPQAVQVFVALRSLGPAGGPVKDLKVAPDNRGFRLSQRNLPLLALDTTPDAIGCSVGDPSTMAQAGNVPTEQQAEDISGWCFGLARYDVSLAPGQTWRVHIDCPQQTYGNLQDEIVSTAVVRPAAFESRAEALLDSWRKRFGTLQLDVPDADFKNAFYASLQHMLTAMVGEQARIAPLSYPLPWLRDSVFMIRAFDLAGLTQAARGATEYCARNDFFSGFGAEGDSPGQGIWAIVQHYRVTRDKGWLIQAYPAIRRKCEWLFRMRRTDRPIQIFVDTPTLPYTQGERAAGVICAAAQDGIIMGSMDHRIVTSLGWVNHWALAGLREATYAAHELGLLTDEVAYRAEADALANALQNFAERHPEFWLWERTVNSALWPTQAWQHAVDRVEAGFNRWWAEYRGATPEDYKPEPYWLYFEFAQGHNALLLGQRDRAWQVMRYRLAHQDLPGLYGWREGGNGVGTRNAVYGATIINQLRGAHRFDHIHPHGWSQSEMWLLQRAMLVEEWQDGLLLFAGVPLEWLKPGSRVAIQNFPTWYGTLSAELQVDTAGQSVHIAIAGLQPGTPITLRLPGHDTVFHANHDYSPLHADVAIR